MTRVTCGVVNCSYNENNTCYAGQILISEQGLTDYEYTCCGSYLNKEAYSNLAEYTTYKVPVQSIKCKVGNCRHYRDNECTLSEVHISGKAPTHIYIETNCNSFESR